MWYIMASAKQYCTLWFIARYTDILRNRDRGPKIDIDLLTFTLYHVTWT